MINIDEKLLEISKKCEEEIKTELNPKALGKSERFFCTKNRVAKCDGLLYNIGKFKRYDEEK